MTDILMWRQHPHGLVHCRADTAAGRYWIEDNVPVEPWQRDPDDSFVIEGAERANAIYAGAICDGLNVATINAA